MVQAPRDFGVGWHTAMLRCTTMVTLVEDSARPDGIGALGLGREDASCLPCRRITYVSGFVDLHPGRLLDIALGRNGSVVEA